MGILPAAPQKGWLGAWNRAHTRRLRAAVITLWLVANGAYAVPYYSVKAEDRTNPEYRKVALDLWWSWFGRVSPVERPAFDRVVRGAMFAEHDLVLALRAPFRPVFDLLHVNQQWGLFAVVATECDALVIEVRRGGDDWSTLYRRLDGEHDWHDRQLKYRRIRGVWDGVGAEPKGTYKRLSKWIARTVFRELPDVDRVRVMLEHRKIPAPGEPVDPNRTKRAEQYFKREVLMKEGS